MPEDVHAPVMAAEVLEVLSPRPGERFLDLTVGAAGHAARLAERLGKGGVLIGMDLDSEILDIAAKRLDRSGGPAVHLFHDNYVNCREVLKEVDLERVDGVLLDLGVSSLQLDNPERGFSFAKDGPLDMRMDPAMAGPTAAQIVNRSTEQELARIFWEYGEERFSRRVARRIVEERSKAEITRTGRLADIVRRASPGRRQRRIDPATRVFQALRIEVNAELDNLRSLLDVAPEILEEGGRIAVIAFHSLEDRIVKEDFRNNARLGRYVLVNRKPLRPAEREVAGNPRSRSARLRAAGRSRI